VIVSLAALILTSACGADVLPGVADERRDERRARFLEQMRTLAVATTADRTAN
jgi:hypothetical protein